MTYQEPSNRTLFLDFDGVVHPTVATPKQLFGQAPMLVEAIVRWQPRVVISSSWRFHFSLEEILSRLPQAIAVQVQGKTGEAHIGKHARWHEIQAYCSRHRIANWRALDDSAFAFPADCEELIRCDGAVGLTSVEVMQLESWLAAPEDRAQPSAIRELPSHTQSEGPLAGFLLK